MLPWKIPIGRRRGTSIRWATTALLTGALLVAAMSAVAADRGADGRFEKRTSSHFVLYQDVDIDESGGFRGSRRFEQELLSELERAYDRLGSLLGLRPSRPRTNQRAFRCSQSTRAHRRARGRWRAHCCTPYPSD